MGFWSDLGSAIGSICSAIGSVCSAIGGAIASKIGALATTIAPFLGPVAQAVVAIAQIIGIFIKDDNVEDLGEAMRKADKKPEDFDSINDYITYLRAEIKSGNITLDTNKTEIDCSNWHWVKSMSSYNNNYYYDTLSDVEFYLEECDEDYGDYLYYACDKSGKKIKYLGYTNREGSVENCEGNLVLDTSMPT